MDTEIDLQRFIEAQASSYEIALHEIKKGRKQSHWMWYIFPQLKGLGFSSTSNYYAIKNKAEAVAYLAHPVLGHRLVQICGDLLQLKSRDAHQIFGSPDDQKLRSSMTLFATVPNADPVFKNVLDAFFDGEKDQKTLTLLQ
jgi:uncharacterized protein (DUF1810 family)